MGPTSHTPSPWYVRDTYEVVAASQIPVAITLNENGRMLQSERQANTQLLAAAPELLEACKAVIKMAQDARLRALDGPVLSRLARAIAHAEGRT